MPKKLPTESELRELEALFKEIQSRSSPVTEFEAIFGMPEEVMQRDHPEEYRRLSTTGLLKTLMPSRSDTGAKKMPDGSDRESM